MKPLSLYTSITSPLYQYLRRQQSKKHFADTVELTITFLVIIFFLVFAIRPTALTISKLIGDIKAKELQVDLYRQRINSIIEAQDSFSNVQADYSLISQAFPENPHLVNSAADIVGSLSEADVVTVPKITFDFDTEGNFYQAQLSTRSAYPNFNSWLNSFQKIRRLSDSTTLTISGTQENDGSIKFNFPVNFYYGSPPSLKIKK
jgi:hypothetical protein